MLNKLNFNLRIYNYSNNELNLHSYDNFIENSINSPCVYTFSVNTPLNIHLADKNGIVFYHQCLWLISIRDDLYYDTIEKSYIQICNNLNQLITENRDDLYCGNDIYVSLYISETHESYIDTLQLFNSMKHSEIELKKMVADFKYND